VSGPLVLSLFPGIGLLDRAFEEEGFCVVRGPDLLWGGDVRSFHPPAGRFDGMIGGPPCQRFSPLSKLVEHNGYELAPDLIPEFVRCVREAAPVWFVMENVPEAPLPVGTGYSTVRELIRDVWVGGESNRLRSFTFGGSVEGVRRFHVEQMALHRPDPMPAALAAGFDAGGKRGAQRKKKAAALGYKTLATLEASLRAQGLPPDFLADAPFTVAGKCKAVGNGVPLPMGRAVARAVKRALYPELLEAA
jgi:DNA (cytosine-5)-methyltransferase 1